MNLYHVTPKNNLQSILKHGLVPHKTDGLARYFPDSMPYGVIWLTDNVQHVLNDHAGEEWIREYNPIVFEVDTRELDVCAYISYNFIEPKLIPNQYYIRGTVSSDRLHLVQETTHLF